MSNERAVTVSRGQVEMRAGGKEGKERERKERKRNNEETKCQGDRKWKWRSGRTRKSLEN